MVKPARIAEAREVVYDDRRWELLHGLRERALKAMEALAARGMAAVLHGSVARGDVDARSDVDVMLPDVVPSYLVELSLREAGLAPARREIVMATPWQLPKAHVYLDENYSVTFPLVEPRRLELEFYHFGGAVELADLKRGRRVPGVDKRLMLIEPTTRGHVESPVIGREAEVAKRVGVSLDIVRERVQVLTRRADIGRTGVFIQRELAPQESFEAVFKELVERNPEMKLRLKRRLP